MRFPVRLLALPMVVLYVLPAPADAKDDLLRRIDDLHNRVYGQENLLLKPFGERPQDDVVDWRRLMADVRVFIDGITPAPDLRAAMAAMDRASERLITVRKRNWNENIRQCIDLPNPDAGLSRLDKARIRFYVLNRQMGALYDSVRELRHSVAGLDDVKHALRRRRVANGKERDVLEVVDRLGQRLEAAMLKYEGDVNTLGRAVKGASGNP